jgi:hypothetical protein
MLNPVLQAWQFIFPVQSAQFGAQSKQESAVPYFPTSHAFMHIPLFSINPELQTVQLAIPVHSAQLAEQDRHPALVPNFPISQPYTNFPLGSIS